MQAFCVPRDFTTAQGTTLDARRARYLAKIAIGWLLPLSKVPTATMKLDQVQPPQAYSVEIDATRLIDAAHPTGPSRSSLATTSCQARAQDDRPGCSHKRHQRCQPHGRTDGWPVVVSNSGSPAACLPLHTKTLLVPRSSTHYLTYRRLSRSLRTNALDGAHDRAGIDRARQAVCLCR